MNKETISIRQAINIMSMFIIGSSVIVGVGGEAKNDIWLALLIAIFLSLVLTYFYSQILMLFPGIDFVNILKQIFGKFFGNFISVLFVWFSFHLGSLVLRDFGEFVKTVGLPETPNSIVITFAAVLAIFSVKKGIETIGRACEFLFVFLISVLFITVPFLIPKMDTSNLRPFLYNGIGPVLKGSFSLLSFPFAETVVFIFLLPYTNEKKYYKVFSYSIIITGLILLITSLRNIMVVGADSLSRSYFASYSVVSRIKVGEFFQRIESFVAIAFSFYAFAKINVCLYATSIGLSKILGFDDYRFLVTPLGILMINYSIISYNNIMQLFDWAGNIWPYYAFPFQVVFPLFIFFYAKLYKKYR
ncbi:Spore germination protein YndE [Caloramator mitchellensis]|uniref:Spore germination protein YndE n=1 Tax=Caloramator mitchellensis TaxID=908809 RepID=A0A0R3K1T8_CALMK|nr:endospore germination permease [Caloramator mitchellensis]KRQ87364.1 Spore germination protein YndE [Caloramator mitchellensis]